jgi:hypothetical protein
MFFGLDDTGQRVWRGIQYFFLICIVRGESNWVYSSPRPAPLDYDDGETGGMMIGRGNRSTRRKLKGIQYQQDVVGRSSSLLSFDMTRTD